MRLCINMLIFTHNLGNWLIHLCSVVEQKRRVRSQSQHNASDPGQ